MSGDYNKRFYIRVFVAVHVPCVKDKQLFTSHLVSLMVSHRGHNCIFSALTILERALTS